MTGAIGAAARALLAPWSFAKGAPAISSRAATFLAAVHVVIAAALSVLLSTWTYLTGKGLIMAAREMDMGMDDLPADSVAQVAGNFVAAFAVWACLLALAVGIAAAVADLVYRDDRDAFRVAMRRTAAMTIWFIVWAAAVLLVNSLRHGEVSHPAAAIRAYAQGNQHWFNGSSAFAPGPIEREPLAAPGRLRALVAVFPLIWSLALPPARGRRPLSGPVLWAAVVLCSWVAWWGVWRLLPMVLLEAVAG